MGRLIIVSNRLPVTIRRRGGGPALDFSAGGLATGLGPYHASHDSLWIGWAGSNDRWSDRQWSAVEAELKDRRYSAIDLTAEDVAGFYAGFSNEVIWPLCHYQLERIPLDTRHWDAYQDVNRRYAAEIVVAHRPGDLVWINDYQLMLVPSLLRAQKRDVRIAYFHHIPFPAYEVFRTLPWGRALLEGVLGADVIGVHTESYLQHFRASVSRLLGVDGDRHELLWQGRRVSVGAHPMGIDVRRFEDLAADPGVRAEAARIRAEAGGRSLLLSVDRLDYTKGIPRRLLAFDRFLRREPALRDRVRLVMVAVPSRGDVPAYRAYRSQIEGLVGRINGEFGSVDAAPVHYLHRAVSPERLVALYLAADVLIVSPLRDGMNLVAKEFVASRADDDGVIVLSEFAGAAEELREAVLVNPYDIDGFAERLGQAVRMPKPERRARMHALRARVLRSTVDAWADRIVAGLNARPVSLGTDGHVDDAVIEEVASHAAAAPRIQLFVDYDGTLVPFVDVPDLATPDPGLLTLLGQLAGSPGLTVNLISGRPRETLQEWFRESGLTLWAEHGMWHSADGHTWITSEEVDAHAVDEILPAMEDALADTPGSSIERKGASIAWHYRLADPVAGPRRAAALLATVSDPSVRAGLSVIDGQKVVEVRPRNVNKGIAVRRAHQHEPPGTLFIAMGDDATDEDMFSVLPSTGVAIIVGDRASSASRRLGNWQSVRRLLAAIVAARTVAPAETGPGTPGGTQP